MRTRSRRLRARGVGFAHDADDAGRPAGRGRGPGRRRPRDPAAQGSERHQARTRAICWRAIQKQTDDTDAFRTLVEALPAPIWARDEAGKLIFVNAAYARAVEAKDAADAVRARHRAVRSRGARRARARASTTRASPIAGRLPAIVAGSRRSFDVLTFPSRRGSAGIGIDATEAETMRAELARMADAHRRTLDQLTDRRRHLRRRPAAGVLQRRLPLALGPRCRLPRSGADRSRRCSTTCAPPASCPSRQTSASGRRALHDAYRALEAEEHTWHLPDGRTRAGGHHAQSRRRRDLSVPRRHRAARSRAALRRADPGPGRDARQSHRGGRGVRAATAGCGCSIRFSRACGSSIRRRSPSGRISRP